MFHYSDRAIQLHKDGMSWHDATLQARKEYAAQFNCVDCSESVTTPGYVFDGHPEPAGADGMTRDPVVNDILKRFGLRAKSQPVNL